MLAFDAGVEDGGCFVGASGLSLLVVSFGVVAFGTEGVGDGQLLHALVFLYHLELLIMHVRDDVFLLTGQVVVVAAGVADEAVAGYRWFDQQDFVT